MAGVSLARGALHGEDLRRGDERPATLLLSGPDGEAAYDVTVRLAARGPRAVELAFVRLPPSARRVLEEGGPVWLFGDAPDGPAAAQPRRLMLPLSTAVAEATRRRRPPSARAGQPVAKHPASNGVASGGASLSAGKLLLLTAGLVALAVLIGWLLVH